MVSSTKPIEGQVPLYSIPKSVRPPHGSILQIIIFAIFFNGGIILVNLTQILSYPLSLLPLTKKLHLRISLFTKASFGTLTVFLSERFAPTKFIITTGKGMPILQEEWLEKDSKGKVIGIKLPDHGIWISNHQTLADWLYLWSFMYLANHHTSILITLKSSIKWIPFVGWACQLYGFIFLARNWLTDKTSFKKQLKRVTEDLDKLGDESKLALLVFPEGTLVTGNTRPISKKYADKLGVEDFKHVLLPRSTGLFFALRTLAITLPSLTLIDLTLAYPGPKLPNSYPEDHYDLTIWMKSVPPPSIHVHLRIWNVIKEVPIGDISTGHDEEGTEEEKIIFDSWLREKWGEKDLLLDGFLKNGKFEGVGEGGKEEEREVIEWPVELRHWWENFEAFSYFIPVVVLWFLIPFSWNLISSGLGLLGIGVGEVIKKEAVVKKACGCGKKMVEKVLTKAIGEL